MRNREVIRDIALRFGKTLDEHSKHMECFCLFGCEPGGWLKEEFLRFLDELKTAKEIVNFNRDVSLGSGGNKADFCIEIGNGASSELNWVEVKLWMIGHQKVYEQSSPFYFGDSAAAGIKPDVEKLLSIERGGKFLLILSIANPGGEWMEGVSRFNENFSPLCLVPLIMPEEVSTSHFPGLLEVMRAP
ncbi:hypothetical protein ACFLV3_03875 [Chloroflexota bacterium]